jgi:hypothetical protein
MKERLKTYVELLHTYQRHNYHHHHHRHYYPLTLRRVKQVYTSVLLNCKHRRMKKVTADVITR